MHVLVCTDPREALETVETYLDRSGAEGAHAYGLLLKVAELPDQWGRPVTMLVGSDGDEPVAYVQCTGRYPATVVGFGDASQIDFHAFVDAMLEAGHLPASVNGAVRCSEPFAAAWAERASIETRAVRDTRAFELHQLRPPSGVRGAARTVREPDRALLERWCAEFATAIGEPLQDGEAERTATSFIDQQAVLFWEDDGQAVSMAAINRRTPSSANVAWVYTPPELRGNGYASGVVAAISERELAAGAKWCTLFTDLANPTSNKIYADLGYEPRADFRQFALAWPSGS